MVDTEKSLQDQFAAKSICFGCGPENQDGLQIKSFVKQDQVVATWRPQKQHQAFPGILNGGIIGALLDCHCNWTGAWHLMQKLKLKQPPCTVTSEYQIKLLRPTPVEGSLQLTADLVEITGKAAIISGKLIAENKVCAFCLGTFVAVGEGHPAYHRW
ncbi:MAG: PaaI family thioesterase [Pseudomonadota bacterium]